MSPASLLPPAALVAALLSASSALSNGDMSTRSRSPSPQAAAPNGFAIEQVLPGRRVALRASPGGRVIARLGPRTEFGSPRVLPVEARSGPWLAVADPRLGNDRVGWLDPRAGGVQETFTQTALRIDLTHRRLELVQGGQVERRMPIAIGAASSPTPRGRFAVTDKLRGTDFNPAYGCCILALSAHQTRRPRGWTGGDRIAIHGGGLATASHGCVHARSRDLRYLMREVALGTPVFIR